MSVALSFCLTSCLPHLLQVQRPFVLETVSLDLFLGRQLGRFGRNFPALSSRLDIVAILDQFAQNFYQVHVASCRLSAYLYITSFLTRYRVLRSMQELDYNLECQNGIKIAEDMRKLPMVVIPKVQYSSTLAPLFYSSQQHPPSSSILHAT